MTGQIFILLLTKRTNEITDFLFRMKYDWAVEF